MTEVTLNPEETRKNYLIRVCIAMLLENSNKIDCIKYDEAECEAFCLAADLEAEFEPFGDEG